MPPPVVGAPGSRVATTRQPVPAPRRTPARIVAREGGRDDARAMPSDAPSPDASRDATGVRDAAFLGVGAMIGAGIFALLGEAGAVAGAAVWLSFLLAGIVATLLGYTVVKLGVRFPSSGG